MKNQVTLNCPDQSWPQKALSAQVWVSVRDAEPMVSAGLGHCTLLWWAPPLGPVGRPIPWVLHKGLSLYIHTQNNRRKKICQPLLHSSNLSFNNFLHGQFILCLQKAEATSRKIMLYFWTHGLHARLFLFSFNSHIFLYFCLPSLDCCTYFVSLRKLTWADIFF